MTTLSKQKIFNPLWFLLLLALLLLLIFYGCGTVKKSTTVTDRQTVKTDTLIQIKEVNVFDTVIKLQSDSSLFQAMIECDSNNQAYVSKIIALENGEKIRTRYVFKDKILKVESRINEDSIIAYWKTYYESEYKATDNTSATVTDNTTIKRSGLFAWLKWLLIGFVCGAVFWWSKKYWIKLLAL